MPRCRNCMAPIFLVKPAPNRWEGNPKALPVDVNPDPAGTIGLYQVPSPFSMYPAHRDFKGERKTYMRRLGGEALKAYTRLGGVVYRVHFDTCKNRQPYIRKGTK